MNAQQRSLFAEAVKLKRSPVGGLAEMFVTPRENIFPGTEVVFDLMDVKEDLALDRERNTGYNLNKSSEWDEKRYRPPYFAEKLPLNVARYDVRSFGMNEFDAGISRDEAMMMDIVQLSADLLDKIERSREKQACDVLQTGILTPNIGDALDFGSDSGNFATVSTAWSNVASTPLTDLKSIADNIRRKGKRVPNKLIFGDTAWANFKATTQVRNELDNRRLEAGFILQPQTNGGYLIRHGQISTGDYIFDLYTHAGEYQVKNGTWTKFVNTNKVILMADGPYQTFYAGLNVLADAPASLKRMFSNVQQIGIRTAMQYSVGLLTDTESKATEILVESSFATIPKNPNCFGCLTTTV